MSDFQEKENPDLGRSGNSLFSEIVDETLIITETVDENNVPDNFPVGKLAGQEERPAVSETTCAAACHKAQIDTFFSYFSAWKGGTLLKIHKATEKEGTSAGGGRRGKITDFTWETKVRILQTLGKLDKSELPVYWVATFPDEYYEYRFTGERTTRVLDAFRERYKRRFPTSGIIWRREHERRKSGAHVGEFFPHYNFLVYGVDLGEFQEWAGRAWWEICGKLSGNHLAAVWRAERVKDWKQMVYYLSKYVAKKNKDYFAEPGWGAWWGVINTNCLPWVSSVVLEIDERQATQLLRYAKRKIHGRRNVNTRTFNTENPEFWVDRLGEISRPGSRIQKSSEGRFLNMAKELHETDLDDFDLPRND